MRDTDQTTNRHYADTEDHVPEHISANEEREALSIERILRTMDGMAVWGGERDYERYGT